MYTPPPKPSRYRVERKLARGAVGEVYEVTDNLTGGRVALKRLSEKAAAREGIVRLFEREYHTLLQLQHPRIIRVYDYGVDDERPYYTMELLDGHDLRELAPLEYHDACRCLRDVASSLALLHARRMIHRDLSTRNVRLTSEGRAKLIDFGTLVSFGATGPVAGTPSAVSPEALHGHPLDQRADLYALGTLAYWLLTGRHAYEANRLQVLPRLWRRGPPQAPSVLAPGIPPELDELVLSLIDLDPMRRPSSAAAVIERLDAIGDLSDDPVVDVSQGYLHSPQLVGRSRDLDRVKRFVERVVDGNAGTLLVEGETGIGKTRLVDEGTIGARLRGATVLRVDAEEQRGPHGVTRAVALGLLTLLPEVARTAARSYSPLLERVIPELSEDSTDEGPSSDAFSNDTRAVMQSALGSWLRRIASQKPLVVVLDNAHAADELSLGLFVALARRASGCSLGVVATHRTDAPCSVEHLIGSFRDEGNVITLGGLAGRHTTELVEALFGEVDNTARLASFIQQRTGGNPMHCLTLTSQMISEGHIRYRDGSWVLPSELTSSRLPASLEEALSRREASLGPDARELARALCIQSGAVGLEQCAFLSRLSSEALFGALTELVEHDVLTLSGAHYRFSREAFRRHLSSTLPEELERELHRRAGEFLLSCAHRDPFTQIEAGWHLLRGGEELLGAEILGDQGGRLVERIEGLELAGPGLEAALEVFDRQERPDWERLNVLEALVLAGWYVHPQYADAHGRRATELALKLTGLDDASSSEGIGERLDRARAAHDAIADSIAVGRYRDFDTLVRTVANCLAVRVSVAASRGDARRAREIVSELRVLADLPEQHALRITYDHACHVALASEGRYLEALEVGERVIERLEQGEATHLMEWQIRGMAIATGAFGTEGALFWADRLEALGGRFQRTVAHQVRFVYHANRGEIPKAEPHREQLELDAIERGCGWQASMSMPYVLGTVHTLTGDVVRLRLAADALEAQVDAAGASADIVTLFRAAHQYWLGRPQAALALLETVSQTFTPREHALWPLAQSLTLRSLCDLGRREEALAGSRRARSELGSLGEELSTLTRELRISAALVEARCGDPSLAARDVDALIEEHVDAAVPLAMTQLHEARALIALEQGDDVSFSTQLEDMEAWARASGTHSLVARCKRLEIQGKRQLGPLTPPSERVSLLPGDSARTIRNSLLSHPEHERAAAALALVVDETHATRGYLYLGTSGSLQLHAQYPIGASPPADLASALVELAAKVDPCDDAIMTLENTDMGDQTLTALTEAVEPGPELGQHLLVTFDERRAEVVGAIVLKTRVFEPPPSAALLSGVAAALKDVAQRSSMVVEKHGAAEPPDAPALSG